jgi:hypothetical protein
MPRTIAEIRGTLTDLAISGSLVAIAMLPVPVKAQPSLISWQGLLTDTTGQAVNGSVDLSFGLYEVQEAGTPVWTMDTLSISVQNGLVSLPLGPFENIDFGKPHWLGVTVDAGIEISPRSPLLSSPSALTLFSPTTIRGDHLDDEEGVLTVSNSASSGVAIGLSAETDADSGRALLGVAAATSGRNYGVRGETASPNGRGVFGRTDAQTGQARGVMGWSRADEGVGVYGRASSTTGSNYGVRGMTDSPDGYSGYFTGGRGVYVDTTLAAGGIHAATDGVMFPDSTIQISARLYPVAAGTVEISHDFSTTPEIYASNGNIFWSNHCGGCPWEIRMHNPAHYNYKDFVTIVTSITADSSATLYPRFISDVAGHLILSLLDSSGTAAEGVISFVIAVP